MRILAVWLALGAWAGGAGATELSGRVVEGSDASWSVPPAGAVLEPYRNAGYELSFVDGAVAVRVELAPLRASAPWSPPPSAAAGPVSVAARVAAGGATTEYEVVSRVLAWVREHVRYDLDRTQGQDPEQVLRRGSAYCTGVARLAVAMLEALGVEAREVPGFVLVDQPNGARAGFHRWIEVHYTGIGWTFSDPLATHHFVPASYLRLASDRLEEAPGEARLLRRIDATAETDLAPSAPAGVRVRANGARRNSAALVLVVEGAPSAEAVLVGGGGLRTLRLEEGRGRFLGIEPGRYELRVNANGRLAAWKSLIFRAPVLAELVVAVPAESVAGGLAR